MKQDFTKYQEGEPAAPATFGADVIVSPDTRRAERLPPGQARTRKWPVLHHGAAPIIPTDRWRLEVLGLVDRPFQIGWDEFRNLPRVKVYSDFHCVTRWSRLGNLWEGVTVGDLVTRAGIQAAARFALIHSYDGGWTTNVPLADLLAQDVVLADTHDGEAISADHGGPVRLVIPRLYAWKSAKWVHKIELLAEDCPGFWERLGYHRHGDPWSEERYD
jgi:DMSO/TMAO reductase YedYZ molybdopterin-dependent catalytic subunit